MKAQIKVLALILLISGVAALLPTIHAQTYKAGPIFNTSAGHTFVIRYDASISDPDTQTANGFLDQYIPQLFSLFWEPTNDALVTVHQGSTACGEAGGCATGTDVWISRSVWSDAGIWVHEFTHTLQFSGPVFALRDDPYLFYVEATAFVTAGILIPGSVALGGNFALWVPDWGVAEAIFDYNLRSRGETHVDGNIWMGIYRADNYVFKKLNARLNQLASQGLAIADVPSFRELVGESIAPSILDGLPIRQWLAVEGLLAKGEVGNSTLFHFGILSYWRWQTATSVRFIVDLVVDEVSTTGYTSLDASLSKATVYDAVTRAKLADVTGAYIQGGGQNDVEFTVDLNREVAAVRVDAHVVGNGLVADRSVLIPLYCAPAAGQLCQSVPSDFILFTTSDNWLQSLTGTAVVGGVNYPIVNGMVAFDLVSPTADVSIPVPPYVVRNFLSSNKLTSASKVMIPGLNYTALQIMRDSDQIITVSTGSTTYTVTVNTYPLGLDSPQGSGTFIAGTAITVSISDVPGYAFEKWQRDGVDYTVAQSFSYTVDVSHTFTAIFLQVILIPLTEYGGTSPYAQISTNCTVQSYHLDLARRLLNFTTTGPDGTVALTSTILPRDLIDGTPIVLIDDGNISPTMLTIASNSTHYFITFAYPSSIRRITIGGSNTIPEFDNPTVVSFISFLVATLVVLRHRITRPRCEPPGCAITMMK